MKLERMDVEAARVRDAETKEQYLRLLIPAGYVWYTPTANGFEVLDDAVGDKLEAAYSRLMS